MPGELEYALFSLDLYGWGGICMYIYIYIYIDDRLLDDRRRLTTVDDRRRHGQQSGTASMGHYAENLFIGVANKLVPIAKPANPANPLKLDFYTREGVYLYIYIHIYIYIYLHISRCVLMYKYIYLYIYVFYYTLSLSLSLSLSISLSIYIKISLYIYIYLWHFAPLGPPYPPIFRNCHLQNIHIAINIHIYIYICTHIHCSKSLSSRNVSNAMFLTLRGPQLFRTPCSQHVFPPHNIAAGETCCEQGVLNSCGPRRVKNRAFETYVATGKTVGTVYMCTYINIYMNVNRKLYMYIYIYI